jgi:gamma-glutamylcyclotransferase (GGCT)/AIG2-like uncharacterized protein YtfP
MLFSLLAYGTLMDKGTLEYVIGRPYEGTFEDATLEGFVRLQPSYYMAFEEEGSHIEGKLISGLTENDVKHLDRYESIGSGMYRRQNVKVTVGSESVDAIVYYNGEEFQKEDYL